MALLATLVLAIFDKIDLSALAHEGISYEGIGYLMLVANTVAPGVSLVSGLFLMEEEMAKVDVSDAIDSISRVTSFDNPIFPDGGGSDDDDGDAEH